VKHRYRNGVTKQLSGQYRFGYRIHPDCQGSGKHAESYRRIRNRKFPRMPLGEQQYGMSAAVCRKEHREWSAPLMVDSFRRRF